MTLVFIDTATGTWGTAEDIVVREMDKDDLFCLDQMSDSEVIEYGNKWGARIVS